jgi:hypothetical protein
MNEPSFRVKRLPQAEMDTALENIFAAPETYDSEKIAASYRSCGLDVIEDPTSPRLADLARDALLERRPHAAIRVGDGEMAVISFRAYPDTPDLDRFCALASVGKQDDRFAVTESWVLAFREIMLGSMARADVVGVPGLWPEDGAARSFNEKPDHFRAEFLQWPRGLYGEWRGRTYLPKLAKDGLLAGRLIASNHLYFAYLSHLDDLVASASAILLMTAQRGLGKLFAKRYPDKPTSLVKIGIPGDPRRTREKIPFFLRKYFNALPQDLTGTLCLVGAGLWSLVYCQWIRERGGVALDMGAGMDLLAGTAIRATQRRAIKKGIIAAPSLAKAKTTS